MAYLPDTTEVSAVPVRPATSFIVIADRPRLEVLLLHRRQESVFVGGMVVFPGGAVDVGDHEPDALDLVHGEPNISVLSGDKARAHLVAGARETVEEVGLWVGSGDAGPIIGARRAVEAGSVTLPTVAGRGSIDARHLPYAGRWVTPAGGPRRYDTHFFLAVVAGQIPEPDGTEVVACEWERPAMALERLERQELDAIRPTIIYITALARFETAAEALDAARRGDAVDHNPGWTTF